ncbi:hypothetical protein BD408DRAFT_447356 [Parasitella parasitica]|nr:hypothetical protein BD408DRAFT_447356 [Parasitella parasitica]
MSQIADEIADEQQINNIEGDIQMSLLVNCKLLRGGNDEVPGFRFNGTDFAPAADTDYIPMSLGVMIPGTSLYSLTDSPEKIEKR